jgi:hypothetical protein
VGFWDYFEFSKCAENKRETAVLTAFSDRRVAGKNEKSPHQYEEILISVYSPDSF